MNKINEESIINDYDVIVLSLYRKVLEQLDGLFLLIEHESKSGSVILLRSLFETSASLIYILKDKEKVEQRAHCYYVSYSIEEITFSRKVIAQKVYDEFATEERFKRSIDSHTKNLNGKYKEVYQEWLKVQSNLERNKSKKGLIHPKWYSLYDGPITLKKLSKKINLLGVYDKIYSIYSLEVHGFSTLSDLRRTKDGYLKYLPLRGTRALDVEAIMSIRLFSIVSGSLINHYLSSYIGDFEQFYNEISIK